MKLIQWIFVIVIFIGLVFKFLHLTGGNEFVLLGCLGLGTFYLLFGVAFFNGLRGSRMFSRAAYSEIGSGRILAAIGLGLSLWLTLVGMALKILSVSSTLLAAGVVGLFFVSLSVFLIKSRVSGEDVFRRHILFKALPAFITGLFLLIVPASANIRFWHHGEDPAYVEKLIYVYDHPDDEKAREELEEMRRYH